MLSLGSSPRDRHSNERARVLAPYGNACLNCVRSKTRCAYSSNHLVCERCQRLRKNCSPAPKKRISKANRYSAPLPSNHTTPTERFSGFEQLLRASNAAHGPITQVDSCESTSELQQTAKETTPYSFEATNQPHEDPIEMEEALNEYRTKMVSYFPVVIIEDSITLSELTKERPFLCLVIRAIATKNLTTQASLGTEIRRVLGREMLFEATKSLDLLLGLLVYGSWSHFYIYKKHIISTVVQLATSLAFDLGITRPISPQPRHTLVLPTTNAEKGPKLPTRAPRTMEERRAVLGLFLLSSLCSNYFQKIEPLRWTPHLDDYLETLEKTREYSTDILLAHLVRAQLITNQVARVPWNDTLGDPNSKLPATLSRQLLQAYLDKLEKNLPQELLSNAILRLHLLHTKLNIYEHSLSPIFLNSPSNDPSSQLERIESLWTCLATIKSWFEIFRSTDRFPLSHYPHISLAIFLQMSHCMVVLFRLSTFDSPLVPWDRHRVKQELDFGEVTKLISDRFGSVPEAIGLKTDEPEEKPSDFWLLTKKRSDVINSWWEMTFASIASTEHAQSTPGTVGAESSEDTDIGGTYGKIGELESTVIDMEFLDDVWTRDLLSGESDFTLETFW